MQIWTASPGQRSLERIPCKPAIHLHVPDGLFDGAAPFDHGLHGSGESAFDPDFIHHHIFDPASGVSPTELASVTVAAPTGIMADGLSSAFMVMGSDKALALARQLQDVDTMLIRKNGTVVKTENFPEIDL